MKARLKILSGDLTHLQVRFRLKCALFCEYLHVTPHVMPVGQQAKRTKTGLTSLNHGNIFRATYLITIRAIRL